MSFKVGLFCQFRTFLSSIFFLIEKRNKPTFLDKIKKIFFLTLQTVRVRLNWWEMVNVMMKPTLQTAALMEVTVVEGVPTQIIVQTVSVMLSHHQ